MQTRCDGYDSSRTDIHSSGQLGEKSRVQGEGKWDIWATCGGREGRRQGLEVLKMIGGRRGCKTGEGAMQLEVGREGGKQQNAEEAKALQTRCDHYDSTGTEGKGEKDRQGRVEGGGKCIK